jgi:hypothetical protein
MRAFDHRHPVMQGVVSFPYDAADRFATGQRNRGS